ncbi:MAG: hypothetical protein HYX92_20780 [Chloroflexi bacterium]|nr:hypothetical protein [Chloroflexota bacterium]
MSRLKERTARDRVAMTPPAVPQSVPKEKNVNREPLQLVFPRAEEYREDAPAKSGETLVDLTEKVVAFIDNRRPNANVALASVREEMEKDFHIRAVVVEHKAFGLNSNEALPGEVFRRLLNEVDAVVVGLAS